MIALALRGGFRNENKESATIVHFFQSPNPLGHVSSGKESSSRFSFPLLSGLVHYFEY